MASLLTKEESNAILQIPLIGDNDVTQACVRWHLNNKHKDGQTSYFQTVDLIISDMLTTAAELPSKVPQLQLIDGHSKLQIARTRASVFLTSVINDVLKKASHGAAVKLILPVEDGYVVRSDFLEQRLYGCPNAQVVEGFVAPREYLRKPKLSSAGLQSFSDILASAAGGIVLGDAKPKLASTALEDFSATPAAAAGGLSLTNATGKSQSLLLSELEEELLGRYSLPWLISKPISEQTIAILGHRSLFMMERWIRGGHALGCKVLVFGQHGSWLEESQYEGLIEAFLPIDMTVDQGLPQRILDALQKSDHQIDGITTTIDVYFDAAAKVSLELGLHTSPPESLAMAQDKYATRTRFGNSTPLTLLVTDIDDLRKSLGTLTSPITYPIVVKPSKGWSSEGVFKVTTESELFTSVSQLNTFQPGMKVIVETYVDGPEVDANFLLWDGEIQFFEVVDDFPCSADLPGSDFSTANFQEREMVYPSNLGPPAECYYYYSSVLSSKCPRIKRNSTYNDTFHHPRATLPNLAFRASFELNVVLCFAMATEEDHTEQPPETTARSLALPTSFSRNHPNHHRVSPHANPLDEKAEPVLPPMTLESESNASTHLPASSSLAENGAVKEQPTERELKECRHVKNSLSRNVWFVAVLGLCERFAYYGIIVMFQNYIQNHRHDPLRPGALGLGQNIAGVMNNVFTLYCLVAPIGAAIVADTWLGRFQTLCLALYIYIVGLIILITTSVPAALEQGAGLPGLIVAMVIMGMGVGGVKATIGPFIADQCTDELYTIKYTGSGEKVIVDKEVTVEYIFNIYYWCVNAGALLGIATTFMEKDVGYWAAFLMPTSVFAFVIIVFHLNRGRYGAVSPPQVKNILPIAFRAMWYGARGGANMDAAKPDNVQTKYGKSVPWSASFIEELKSGLTATRAFIAFIIYWLCQTQMSTNLISQAANMDSHGIPNDLLPTINSVAVVIILPIIQHGVYPLLRRYHVPFPPISRMTVGFIIEAAAIAYVAGIQKLLYSRPPCYSHPRQCKASDGGKIPNDVHVLIQLPVYVLEGLGEIFSNPAGYEYAYTKAPQSMKTVVQAAFQLSSAGGSALALALAPTYSDPKLLIMFSTLAGCMFLDACIFHVVFRKETRRPVAREDEEDGQRGEEQSVDGVDKTGETGGGGEEKGIVKGASGISEQEKSSE